MILGRHPNLWLGFLTAVWNVIIISSIIQVSMELSSAVNVAFGAFIALLANVNSLSIDAGRVAFKAEQNGGRTTPAPKP